MQKIRGVPTAELEAIVSDEDDPRHGEAERELDKREQAAGDPRVAQATGNELYGWAS